MLSGHPSLTGAVIFEAAASGDSLAQDIVERYCRYLAKGLASFQFAFDPESFVLGGGVSEVGELLLEGIRVPCWNRIAIFACCWRRSETMPGSSAQRCWPETVCNRVPHQA